MFRGDNPIISMSIGPFARRKSETTALRSSQRGKKRHSYGDRGTNMSNGTDQTYDAMIYHTASAGERPQLNPSISVTGCQHACCEETFKWNVHFYVYTQIGFQLFFFADVSCFNLLFVFLPTDGYKSCIIRRYFSFSFFPYSYYRTLGRYWVSLCGCGISRSESKRPRHAIAGRFLSHLWSHKHLSIAVLHIDIFQATVTGTLDKQVLQWFCKCSTFHFSSSFSLSVPGLCTSRFNNTLVQ